VGFPACTRVNVSFYLTPDVSHHSIRESSGSWLEARQRGGEGPGFSAFFHYHSATRDPRALNHFFRVPAEGVTRGFFRRAVSRRRRSRRRRSGAAGKSGGQGVCEQPGFETRERYTEIVIEAIDGGRGR